LPVLKKNLENLKTVNNFKIIEKDILNYEIPIILNKKFDIIFLDPPYKIKDLNDVLDKIQKSMILNKNGIIILHRHKNEEDKFASNFKILERKKYGISKIIFLSC